MCDQDSYLLELVRYIHLNPVRAKLVRRPREWRWSGHGEYLGKEQRGLIDPGPVMEELGSPGRYERFIREGVKESYRAEWHPGEQAPFLGPEKFVKRIAKEKMVPAASRRMALGELIKKVATEAGVEAKALRRKGRLAAIVEARDLFIRAAVFKQGYVASEVAGFLACHPSNVSRAVQKNNESY